MHYRALQHPITGDQLKAACAYVHGKRHGSLSEVAQMMNAPWTIFHAYASGKKPVPWSVCAAMRFLVAIKNLQERSTQNGKRKRYNAG